MFIHVRKSFAPKDNIVVGPAFPQGVIKYKTRNVEHTTEMIFNEC